MERKKLLKLINSNVPPKLKKQIETIASTTRCPENVVVEISHQGASDANKK